MKTIFPEGEGQADLKTHGGARIGAGRKSSGLINRKASISLPSDRWVLIDNIQQHEEKTKSEILAQLIQIGLDVKTKELADKAGVMNLMEMEVNEKEKELIRIRAEYSKILMLSNQLDQMDKDRRYAELMTDLEHKFKIPMMHSEAFEKKNPDIMRIYRQISDSRETL